MNENSNKSPNHRMSQALGAGEDCPSLEQLIDLTAGRNGEERRLEAEAHVAGCAHCGTELALYREFEQPEIRADEKAHVDAIVTRLRQNSPVAEAAPWWKSLWTIRWMAPASFAMAAILVGLVLWMPGRSTPPRVSDGDDAMRSVRMNVIGPTGTLSSSPSQFEWSAVKGAVRYRVTLREVDHTQVWTGTVETSAAAIPLEVASKIVPLKSFVWQVLAVDRNGSIIADSGTQQFRVQGPNR